MLNEMEYVHLLWTTGGYPPKKSHGFQVPWIQTMALITSLVSKYLRYNKNIDIKRLTQSGPMGPRQL